MLSKQKAKEKLKKLEYNYSSMMDHVLHAGNADLRLTYRLNADLILSDIKELKLDMRLKG